MLRRPFSSLVCVGVLVLFFGCTPETDPYLLAPSTRSTAYKPCCELDQNPAHPPRFPFPSLGQPVKLPQCDGEALGLADLIDIALYNSTQTQTTWAAARARAAQYGEAQSYYYPDLELIGVYSNIREADPFGTTTVITQNVRTYYPRLEMSWLLLDMGTRRARSRAFKEALNSANWSHNREIQTVIQEVMVDYFDALAQQGLLESSKADLADAEVNLDATIQKHRAGIADLSDVAMAQTIVAQRELDLLNNLEALEQALGQLTADMGIPSDDALCLADMPEDLPLPRMCESVDALLARAYSVRPDLFAAWANLRSKKSDIDQAYANMLPTLSFDGYLGRTYFDHGAHDNLDYLAQITLDIPIFKGFFDFNKIREARANLETAKAQLRQLEIDINQQVVVGYRTFRIASEKVEAAKDYVTAARTSYRTTLGRYKVGTVDFVTVANAFSELANARAAAVLARQDFFTSLADLAYATGSLDSPEHTQTWKTRICP